MAKPAREKVSRMESPTSMTAPLGLRAVGAALPAPATAPSWGDFLDLTLRLGPSPSMDLPDSTDGISRPVSTDRTVGSAELVGALDLRLGQGPPQAISGGLSEGNGSSVFSSGVVKVLPWNAEGDGWTAYRRPRSKRRETFLFNLMLLGAEENNLEEKKDMRPGGLVKVVRGWTAYRRPRSKRRRKKTFAFNFMLLGAKENASEGEKDKRQALEKGRSRRGRSLVLPSRYLDSVVEPCMKLPSLHLPGIRKSARLAAARGDM